MPLASLGLSQSKDSSIYDYTNDSKDVAQVEKEKEFREETSRTFSSPKPETLQSSYEADSLSNFDYMCEIDNFVSSEEEGDDLASLPYFPSSSQVSEAPHSSYKAPEDPFAFNLSAIVPLEVHVKDIDDSVQVVKKGEEAEDIGYLSPSSQVPMLPHSSYEGSGHAVASNLSITMSFESEESLA